MSHPPPLHDVLLSSADLKERRLLFAELLEAGYEVMPVESIVDAIRALLLGVVKPPLILLDVHGDPQATPEQVEHLLAASAGVPLVLIVGALDRELWKPLYSRVAALLRRPITIGQIVATVRQIKAPAVG
jgi:DNA-binding response OmpR family regulator